MALHRAKMTQQKMPIGTGGLVRVFVDGCEQIRI
jgi:hypothetical protein